MSNEEQPPKAAATAGPDATDTVKEVGEKKKSTKPSVRLLAYLSATKPRIRSWVDSEVSLQPLLLGSESQRISKAVSRHGRSPQADSMKVPFDLFVYTLGFLPPPHFRRRSGASDAKIQAGTKHWKSYELLPDEWKAKSEAIPKVMQTCTMALFLILENKSLTDRKIQEEMVADMQERVCEEEKLKVGVVSDPSPKDGKKKAVDRSLLSEEELIDRLSSLEQEAAKFYKDVKKMRMHSAISKGAKLAKLVTDG